MPSHHEPRHFTYRQAWFGCIVFGAFWSVLTAAVVAVAILEPSVATVALATVMVLATGVYAYGAVHTARRARENSAARTRA